MPSPRIIHRSAASAVVFAVALGLFVAVPGTSAADRTAKTVARDLVVARPAARLVTTSMTLHDRANLIGVSYLGGDASIRLRFRSVKTGWSAWQDMTPSDIGPDDPSVEGNARKATEPVWVGTADRVMVRVSSASPVSDVRLHTVNTLGDSRPRSLPSRMFGAVGSWLRAPAAQAVPAVPEIRTRAQWGADESWRRCCPRYAPTVEVAFIHHTVSPNGYSAAEAPGMIRAIYRYHRYTLDYDDIAYNFLIDKYGVVYEGRAGGTTRPVIGAHTEGMNSKTTGIALLGTFSSAYPTGSMMVALKRFLAWKLDVHHIPPYGHVPMTSAGSNKLRKGQVVNMNRISGHRDAQATECPGNKVYGQLPDVRRSIMPWGAPKFYLNSTPQTLRADGDGKDETVSTKVWMSSSLSWKIDFADGTGTVHKTVTGTGTIAEASWDGKGLAGTLAPSGRGTITIDAWDATNKHATIATVPIMIVTTHLPGSVLTSATQSIFVDELGRAANIPNAAVWQSWFRSNESIAVTDVELARYSPASPVTFRDGTILKTPDGGYHFVHAGKRRSFASPAVFAALGFTDDAAIAATDGEVQPLPQDQPITDPSMHPDGSVVADGQGRTWVIDAGTRRPIPSAAVRKSWYRDAEVVAATTADLALPEGNAVSFRPGTLLKTPDGSYWIASAGKRRLFTDRETFAAHGYSAKSLIPATWSEIGILAYGDMV